MQTLKRGLLLFLVIVGLGCESAVEFPGAPFRSELVVTSEFSAESPWIVIVQRTVGFDEVVTFPVSVENATVTIEGNDGSRVELEHKGGGFYHSNCCKAHAGVTYQLQVEADGFEAVTAIDRLPEPVYIKDVRRTSVAAELGPATRLEVDFEDVGGTHNFYELSILLDSHWYEVPFTVRNADLQDQLRDYAFNDILVPDLYTVYVRSVLLHDQPFDGQALGLVLDTDPYYPLEEIGGEISFKLRAVSEAYYRYRHSQRQQDNTRSNPFAEPVELRSNVTGGRGLFAGYAPETHGVLSDAVMYERLATAYQVGYFQVHRDGTGLDYADFGGTAGLNVLRDQTVQGTLRLRTEDGAPWTAVLDGGFRLQGTTLRFFHSPHSILRDMEFTFDPAEGSFQAGLALDERQAVYVKFVRKDAG